MQTARNSSTKTKRGWWACWCWRAADGPARDCETPPQPSELSDAWPSSPTELSARSSTGTTPLNTGFTGEFGAERDGRLADKDGRPARPPCWYRSSTCVAPWWPRRCASASAESPLASSSSSGAPLSSSSSKLSTAPLAAATCTTVLCAGHRAKSSSPSLVARKGALCKIAASKPSTSLAALASNIPTTRLSGRLLGSRNRRSTYLARMNTSRASRPASGPGLPSDSPDAAPSPNSRSPFTASFPSRRRSCSCTRGSWSSATDRTLEM
mmetsp:Transcript_17034/g.43190  ORF Transcript_17034/g.43190 Transcript_17034/m.43190 type:complete len:268 (-) Transcript_17034:142-945(-)